MRYPAYPKYKESGVQWLGKVPEGWNIKRGRHIGTLIGSISSVETEPNMDETEFNGSMPFAKVDDLNQIDGTLKLTHTRARVRGCNAPKETFILFPKRGAAIFTNKVAIVDQPMCFDTNLMGWRIQPSLCTKYVAYCLIARRLDDLADVSTVPQINNKHINPERFPHPPLSEQETIADFLDRETGRIDTLTSKKRALIARLKEKRTALISQTVTKGLPAEAAREFGIEPHTRFKDSGIEWQGEVPEGWVVKKLKYFASNKGGGGIQIGPFGGMLTEVLYGDEGDFKVYGQENTLSGDFARGQRWLNGKQYAALSNYHIYAEDILFTRKGSIGGCCVVPTDIQPGIIDSDTIRLRVNRSAVTIPFILYAFRFSAYLQSQVQEMKRGAILSGLNTSTIANLLFMLPPLSEQTAIADYLDRETGKIDNLTAKVEAAIERLQEYRTALITAAVTGKIDVRQEAA